MTLSIIIVSYNTKELLKKCLRSLEKVKAEIIVVDNNSEDGSSDLIKKDFPEVKVISNKENFGFAKANNQALRQAQGEFILLLNSDTVVKPKALEELVEFAKQHPEAGVIGARLLNPDGSVQPSVFHLPTIKGAVLEYWLKQKGTFEKYFPVDNDPREVEAVVGAAMLIPKTVIEKVGLLDERYFMYFEDLDYCRRVKHTGFKVYYLPQAEIIHQHGASGKTIGNQTNRWLIESSKIYHGNFRYSMITFIIWSGQKLKKICG